MPLVLRLTKGSPLTNAEVDGNFTYLDEKPVTDLAGGDTGYIPYQSAEDTTSLLAPSTAGYVLTTNGVGEAPSWQKAAAGAMGGGTSNAVFFENDQTVTDDYTITAGKNAGTFGPVTINDGITVTVPDSSVWTIV